MFRSRAIAIVVAALGCLAIGVSSVAAKPKPLFPKNSPVKLLPHRSCKGLLSVGDFPGAVSEGPGPPGLFDKPGAFVSICGYYPEEKQPTALEPEPPPPTGGGEDVLAVYPRLDYAPRGKPTDIVGPLIAQVDKAQDTVTSLHGVGTHAYVVIDEEGNGIGIMQVRNDLFEVFKESPAGIPGLLAKVAGELGKS